MVLCPQHTLLRAETYLGSKGSSEVGIKMAQLGRGYQLWIRGLLGWLRPSVPLSFRSFHIPSGSLLLAVLELEFHLSSRLFQGCFSLFRFNLVISSERPP